MKSGQINCLNCIIRVYEFLRFGKGGLLILLHHFWPNALLIQVWYALLKP